MYTPYMSATLIWPTCMKVLPKQNTIKIYVRKHKKITFYTHESYKTILFNSEEGCTVNLKKEWQGKSGKGN